MTFTEDMSDPTVFRLNREVLRLQKENQLLTKRLADSVNARAVIEGTLIVGVNKLPAVILEHMHQVVANAMANAKEVDPT